MNFGEFKAGAFKQQYHYRSFTPTPVNHSWVWDDPKINTLLEDATRTLGERNAFSIIVPNVDLFIHMHVVKEANTSSRIESGWERQDWAAADHPLPGQPQALVKTDALPVRLFRKE